MRSICCPLCFVGKDIDMRTVLTLFLKSEGIGELLGTLILKELKLRVWNGFGGFGMVPGNEHCFIGVCTIINSDMVTSPRAKGMESTAKTLKLENRTSLVT